MKRSSNPKFSEVKGINFEEFLSLVIKEAKCLDEGCMNAHWKPFYATCPFCSHDFTGEHEGILSSVRAK